MRREFKPTLRQDIIRKAKIVTPPTEEEFEVVINVGTDTTLRYAGSPLMDPSLVLDSNTTDPATPVTGIDANYSQEDWLAIGLATDNVALANNDQATDEVGNPIGPLDGSGGQYQPPINGNAEYTQIGPSRSALFFDLSDIPADAEILEATLELVPYEIEPGDVYGESTTSNEWPDEGVTCEVLNLPHDATANATWNTKTGSQIQFTDPATSQSIVLPNPNDRWWRENGGMVPPNAIGLAQNTRRSDIPEPAEFFVNQINTPNFSVDIAHQIDGPDGDTTAEEYYGHIGYGISGGGYAVGFLDPANPQSGHPQFHISKALWNEQQTNTFPTTPISVDVLSCVSHALVNNKKCNLLIRAANWDDNTAAQNPNDQLTFEDVPDIVPMTFTSAHLSDSSGGFPIDEIENNSTLHVVTDISGEVNSVTYEWLIEIPVPPYVPIDGVDATITGSVQESATVSVDTITVFRGGAESVNTNDVVSYEWLINGIGTGVTDSPFTIPDDAGGDELSLSVTVTNSIDDDPNVDTFTDTIIVGTIAVDGVGSFNLIRVSPTANNIDELNTGEVRIENVTGVANPTFTYEWRRGPVENSTQNSTLLEQISSTSATTSSFQAPEVGPGDLTQFFICRTLLLENGVQVAERFVSWQLNDVPPPPQPAQRNGVYKVDNVAVFTNCSSNDSQLLAHEYSVLEGCSYTVIEEPSQVTDCSSSSGQYGTPFGYYTNSSRQLVAVAPTNLDRYWFFDTTPPFGGLIGFASKGDGSGAGSRNFASPLNSCTSSFPIEMITVNGYNGTDTSGTGKRPGSVAVWIPDFSESNGWIIMDGWDKPANRSNGTPGIGGFSTGGLIRSESSDSHASGYGGHDGSQCTFGQFNNYISWKVRTSSSSAPDNADAARSFLRGLPPCPPTNASSAANPSSFTTNKLNDVYLVFFDKKLTQSEAQEWVSGKTPADVDPSYGGGGGEEPTDAGGLFDSLNIPTDAITHPSNGNSQSTIIFEIATFDGANPLWSPGTNAPVFLTEDHLIVYDKDNSLLSLRPTGVLDSPQTVYDNFRKALTDDPLYSGQGSQPQLLNINSDPDGPIQPPVSYNGIQFGYWVNGMEQTGQWEFFGDQKFQATFTSWNIFLNSPLGSQQKMVMEIIRNGEVVGRMTGADDTPDQSGVVHGIYPSAAFGSWYSPSKWQIGDIIVVSSIPTSVSVVTITP